MLESLLHSYGYAALLIGTFLEGETILVLGGVAAHLDYLALPWVVACGFVGSLCGDQLYFYLGRRHGSEFLARRPTWQARSRRAHRIFERHPVLLILGFRFLYGLRTITPFVLGTSNVPYPLFSVLNAVGAGIWASLVALAGYYFGQSVELVLGEIKRYEIGIFVFVAGCGVIVWLIVMWRQRRATAPGNARNDADEKK